MQLNPVVGLVGLITIEPLRSTSAARTADANLGDDATLDELFERLASGDSTAPCSLEAVPSVAIERPRWTDPLVLVADCGRLMAELDALLARVRRQRRLAS